MGRLTARVGCALALTASMALFAPVPANAAATGESTASLPETVLKIRSIDWQNGTGTVRVTARVKCTGEGTFTWDATLEQKHARDHVTANVPCDGDGYRSTIVLDPRNGRFHPGPAEFTHGSITCGTNACIGFARFEMIRISP